MFKLKSLLKHINLLNIVLLICSLILAQHVLFPLLNFQMQFTLPSAKIQHFSNNQESKPPVIHFATLMDYAIVSEENLFHPDRKIPVAKKEEPSLPKPDFILYGILLSDTVNIAYLEDKNAPRNTPGRGKRQTSLKKGDALSGFTLKEVDIDKIVMARGEEKMTVYVRDPQKPKSREFITTSSPSPAQSTSKTVAQKPGGQVSSSTPQPSKPKIETTKASALEQMRSGRKQENIETKVLPPQNAEEQAIFDFIEKGRKTSP